jgi:hypothetical protein
MLLVAFLASTSLKVVMGIHQFKGRDHNISAVVNSSLVSVWVPYCSISIVSSGSVTSGHVLLVVLNSCTGTCAAYLLRSSKKRYKDSDS